MISEKIASARQAAAAYSWRKRVYISALTAVYIACLLIDSAVLTWNLAAAASHRKQLQVAYSYQFTSDVSFLKQMLCLVVPRQLVIAAAALGMLPQLYALLNFRREPEVDLQDYMPSEEAWPTLDIFLPR